ncbi:MAG: InlB B-repeat-containing protein, partial [Bacteroidales bacterium]|nr:InlB B-repeat-containing protein [Bacteroidales bacterium]
MKKHLLIALLILALLLLLAPAAFADGEKYTVTFNANGGWFGDDGNETEFFTSYSEGDIIYAGSYEPVNPDRHMAFSGWYYDAACTQPACGRDEDYTVTGDVTLYAGWSRYPTAELGDNTAAFTNGREAFLLFTPEEDGLYIIESHDEFDTYGYLYDQDGNELSSNDDGGENYNFRIDWELAAGALYRIGVRPYSGDSSGEIHFSIVKENTLTLDANGGYFGDNENETEIVTYYPEGANIWARAYEPVHPDRHMIFDGWYYDTACTQLACDRKADYTVTGDVTLYAGWTEGYIVTFDAGDGQFRNGGKTYDVTIPKGSVVGGYSIPESSDQSLGFDYWTLADGTRVDTWSYTPTEDVTLYAHYSTRYTVTYNANGGWFWDDENETEIVTSYPEGANIWAGAYEPVNPDRHMAFSGWYYDAACTQLACDRDADYTVAGDVTLYAGWTEGYIVTYNANGGWFWDDENETEIVTSYP